MKKYNQQWKHRKTVVKIIKVFSWKTATKKKKKRKRKKKKEKNKKKKQKTKKQKKKNKKQKKELLFNAKKIKKLVLITFY